MLIKIDIKEKRAQTLGSPVIVCGNTDNVIEFTFDEEWAASQTRTARFVYIRDGAVKYMDVVFNGNKCSVPLISNTKEVRVGVFAGELMTTTPAVIPCELSILCGTGTPEAPTPSQYDQIMALLNEKRVLDAVLFSSQELGEEQQSIARANIGAAAQADLETAQQNNMLMAQELQQQLQTTDQNLGKHITETQEGLESLTTLTVQSVNGLQEQVDKKAEIEEFDLVLNADTNGLETDDATLAALVAALDAGKNVQIRVISGGTMALCAYVTSYANKFITAFHYMKRRLYTWRVYEDEITLYHDIGLLDDAALEYGVNGELEGWSYKKYESGLVEAWGIAAITLDTKDAYEYIAGTGVYCASGYGPLPKNLFTAVTCIVANPRYYNEIGVSARVTAGLNISASILGKDGSDSHIPSLKVGDKFYFNCEIKGRWK